MAEPRNEDPFDWEPAPWSVTLTFFGIAILGVIAQAASLALLLRWLIAHR